MDTVYFKGNYAPSGQDWLHCTVVGYQGAVIIVEVRNGASTERLEYPLANVERVKRG